MAEGGAPTTSGTAGAAQALEGGTRRLTPISTYFGYDRGTPSDRVYGGGRSRASLRRPFRVAT